MMSNENFFKSVSRWREMLMLGALLSGAISLFITIIFAGVMSIWGPSIRDNAQRWLGITELTTAIAELSGSNRVTQQPEGLSYVREPVFLNKEDGPTTVELVIYIGRTEIGSACVLREIIPLFVDDDGQTHAGEPRRPSQQLGREVVRSELILEIPPTVQAGYVSLTLQLEYTCGPSTVFEQTESTGFYLIDPDAEV